MTNAKKTHESAKTRKRTTKNAQTQKTHPISPNHTKKNTQNHTKPQKTHKKPSKAQKT